MPTIDEYTARMTAILKDANTAPAEAEKMLSDLKADLTTLGTLAEKSKQDDKTIGELRDTNMQFFLKQTTSAPPQTEQTNDADAMLEKILKSYNGGKQ